MLSPKTELLFWLSIMRDHMIFESSTLAPKETEYIESAEYYRDLFQTLLERAAQERDITGMMEMSLQALLGLIEFKKSILKGILTCQLEISLPPSLINHQINEALEFQAFLTLPPPPLDPLNRAVYLTDYLKIWLSDGVGHAAGIISFLDPAEALLSEEVEKFKSVFEKSVIKAEELAMSMSRVGLLENPLMYFTEEVIQWFEKFIGCLEKIKDLRCFCKIMGAGTLVPLLPDHLIREHRFYIAKAQDYLSK